MMLANFAAQLSSIPDKEMSDAGRAIIDELRFPFIVTDTAEQPIIARGIGGGLREKIRTDTLTPEDRQKIAKFITKMDERHSPIPMKGVVADEGRKIIGYIYYDQTRWSLNPGSAFVITDITDEPILWLNISGLDTDAIASAAGNNANIEQVNSAKKDIQAFIGQAKKKGYSTTVQFNPPYESLVFHYGDTGLIHQLQWWVPLAQMSMVAVFLIIGFIGYQRIKHNEQQAIWAGLAKETAHQLGTPISSLMGWLEILEERGSNDEITDYAELESIYKNMQGDVQRLEYITGRFGEIGSVPKREPLDVSETIHRAVEYFQERLPYRQKQVEIVENHQNIPKVEANESLLQWVIENLIRNSLDAINRNDGKIKIRTEFDAKKNDVLIVYSDNGKGIPRKNRAKVFLPGFSSKKHGWGLGLAIVKRIIEGYHGGSVKIAESGSEGSTFVITLPAKASDH